MEWLRKGLIVMSAVGFLTSGAGLAMVVLGADELEETTKAEVVPRVEAKIRELVTVEPVEGDGRLAAMRNKLAEKSREIADRMLGGDFPERIRTRIAELCVCNMTDAEQHAVLRRYEETLARVKEKLEAALGGKLSELKPEEGMVGALVGGYYVDTVQGLQRELTIFFGLNLVLFALVGAVTFAGALFAATIWAAYLFIFDKHWLAKIVFHGWSGYGHLVLVVLLFGLVLHGVRVIQLAHRTVAPTES
jgi:hypothetical protein